MNCKARRDFLQESAVIAGSATILLAGCTGSVNQLFVDVQNNDSTAHQATIVVTNEDEELFNERVSLEADEGREFENALPGEPRFFQFDVSIEGGTTVNEEVPSSSTGFYVDIEANDQVEILPVASD